jgi:asparaginyl-tRNA synthetase
MPTEMSIRELYALTSEGTELEKDQTEYVQLQGWIRTNRAGKNVSFIALNDGTYFQNAQIVYSADALANYNDVSRFLTGTAISVIGKYVLTPDAKQPFEIQASEINLEGACDGSYPLQKKRHSFEYLREIGHLRPRTNTFSAVFRVRSALAMAIHQFFQDQGFVYVNTPIITGNDAEGAGECFTVTTRSDGNYEEDFFGKHASLTVSGQQQGEADAADDAPSFHHRYIWGWIGSSSGGRMETRRAKTSQPLLSVPSAIVYLKVRTRPLTWTMVPRTICRRSGMFFPSQAVMLNQVVSTTGLPSRSL